MNKASLTTGVATSCSIRLDPPLGWSLRHWSVAGQGGQKWPRLPLASDMQQHDFGERQRMTAGNDC